MATSPADADLLAVCGTPGPELHEAIDRIWDQIPGPRVRVEIIGANAVESALQDAAAQLMEIDRHRHDACVRAQSPELRVNQGAVGHMEHRYPEHAEHSDHGHHDEYGHHEHTEHVPPKHGEHGHMDHSSHQHMHHGAMDMAPGGIALAAGGDDRDGLEMDVLHLRLGPVLCHWPAGLVMRCWLQGDVLIRAQAWVVDDGVACDALPRRPGHYAAARHCDHVVDLLALAAWPGAAAIARAARDGLLSDADPSHAASLLQALERKLRRSRILRWSLRDIASITHEDCTSLQLSNALAGDCYDRLLTQVNLARHAIADTAAPDGSAAAADSVLDALTQLVSGLDVATARLVVASLGIDTAVPQAGRDG